MKRSTTGLAILLACLVFSVSGVAAEEPTAEDYMEFFAYYVGEWTFETDSGSKGTLAYTRSPNGKCLVAYLTMDGKPGTQAIEGYHPGKKCWRHVAWYADGGHGELTLKLDAATLKAGPIGKTVEGKWVQWDADGGEKTGVITTKYVSEDEWVSESDEWRAVIRRVREATPKK